MDGADGGGPSPSAPARRPPLGRRLLRIAERIGMRIDPRALTPTEGVRAALAVGPFLIARQALDIRLLGMSALAAFLTCLCDTGGPVNERVRPTLTYALAGTLLVAAMGLARDLGPVAAVTAGGVVLFGCAMMRIYGQAGQTVGNLLGVAAVLALDHPLDPAAAAATGGAFLAGGLWASLLTLGLWRLHPHQPARRALGACYHALSALVGDMTSVLTEDGDARRWARHAREYRRITRERIETARDNLLGAVRWLGPGSVRAAQGLIRLEVAEQVFGHIIALSDLLEPEGERPDRAQARLAALHGLRRLRLLLRVLARAITTDRLGHTRLIDQLLAGMDAQAATLPPDDPVGAALTAITERMRIAVTVTAPATARPGVDAAGRPPPLLPRLVTTLRANLTRDSLPLRHALRVVVLGVPALAVTMIWYGPYVHWLTITLLVTLQPYYAQTFTRALERVGGTVLGGLFAAAIGLLFTTPTALTTGTIVFLLGAMAVRYVSFALFIAVLTPMIVLLSESGLPGHSELMVAALRGGFTLLGGVIALAGCFLLWPAWDTTRLTAELRTAITAHGTYAAAVLSWLLGELPGTELPAMRRAAGLATNNVEASLSRALLEPARLDRRKLERAMLIDAALRRFAGRLSVLQLAGAQAGPATLLPAETLRAWREWLSRSAAALAAGPPVRLDARPAIDASLPGADGLARMARQLELMAAAF